MRDVEDAVQIEGASEATVKVKEFLTKFKNSPEIEGTLVAELYQVSVGSGEEMVSEFEFEQGDDFAKFVDEIIEAAVEDAEGIVTGGKVKYAVKVQGLRGRHVFKLTVIGADEDDIEDVEDLPNRKGLITQQMRHNEKIMKVAMGAVKDFGGLMAKSLQDKDHRIAELEKVHIEGVKTFAELAQQRHVQELEFRKLEAEEKRKEQIMGTLVQGAPVLLNMLAQKNEAPQAPQMQAPPPTVPGARSPLEALLEGFMASITPDQLRAIMASGTFTPTQMLALMEMAKTIDARFEAEQQSRSTQVNGVTQEAAQVSQT